MLRARLAALALAGSLSLAAGCSTTSTSTSTFGLFHNRGTRNGSCPVSCDCGEVVGFSSTPCCTTGPSCPTGGCGVPLISNAHPPIMEGPALFPPSPTPLVFPGAAMPSAPAPRIAPLPPVTTIPQATATPSPP